MLMFTITRHKIWLPVKQLSYKVSIEFKTWSCQWEVLLFLVRWTVKICEREGLGYYFFGAIVSLAMVGLWWPIESVVYCLNIIAKSNRRLYALRKLKGCGVQNRELVAVHCSGAKESPTYHLWSWLELRGRSRLCWATVSKGQTPSGVQDVSWRFMTFMTEIMHAGPLYPLVSSRVVSSQSTYSLRSGTSCHVLLGPTDRLSEVVSVKYAPYFNCA